MYGPTPLGDMKGGRASLAQDHSNDRGPRPAGPAAGDRAGANLAPEAAVGHRTWEDFLAERVLTKA